MNTEIRRILEEVRAGSLGVEEALLRIKQEPYTELGFAKIDNHRKIRQGAAEVVYGAGKTPAQISGILDSVLPGSRDPVLITRLSEDAARETAALLGGTLRVIRGAQDAAGPSAGDACRTGADAEDGACAGPCLSYFAAARIAVLGEFPEPDGLGPIVVATGGTSDIPVAEEAALTARIYGNEVIRLYDVGVAGLHRLLHHMDEIMSASVIIAIAGMEGALASVIGGLADCPVIAVPTSVGYGASFGGVSALLSMLNSCASGVSVVNIDNGFGAGYLASMINHETARTGVRQ